MKKISSTKLAKALNSTLKEVQSCLINQKLVFHKNKEWILTKKGKEYGGEMFFSKRYGDFIIWPPDLNPMEISSSTRTELINATKIGESLKQTSRRINRVLAELNWIKGAIKGWNITSTGRKIGGVEYEHDSGTTYILWPEHIIRNETLIGSFSDQSDIDELIDLKDNIDSTNASDKPHNTRDKWPTKYRTKDGHRVRSRGEQMIDDYLYECGIVHAYEREVKNIDKKMLCDFYIPAKKGGEGEAVYIEYWGKEEKDDEEYDLNRKRKKNTYLENDINLIELENEHIFSLDDHLPRKLLKFKINVD
jgi:hypothetical protein